MELLIDVDGIATGLPRFFRRGVGFEPHRADLEFGHAASGVECRVGEQVGALIPAVVKRQEDGV
ncbi:hypothetical protein GCM10022402_03710 [Salinactinospora qingdaonensis]|uniref:Uncharacterized protein n=1 Tax=Salinactinospora qingdaonensis TaxID=702744 RepID=A0ABP7EXH0_9ACTN